MENEKVIGKFKKGKLTARLWSKGRVQYFTADGKPSRESFAPLSIARGVLKDEGYIETSKGARMDIEDILGLPKQGNYIKNTVASRKRNVRLEVNSEVTKAERHFLDGMAFFVAGTMSRDDDKYISYVSEVMAKILKHLVARIKKEEEK